MTSTDAYDNGYREATETFALQITRLLDRAANEINPEVDLAAELLALAYGELKDQMNYDQQNGSETFKGLRDAYQAMAANR